MSPALTETLPDFSEDCSPDLASRLDDAIALLAAKWMETHKVWPSYQADLGLEALLFCYDLTGEDKYLSHVEKVWRFRHPPRSSLTQGNCYFTCLHYETYLRNGNRGLLDGLVELAEDWLENAPRDSAGAIGHRGWPLGAILADLLGGLAPLLARAGAISGEEKFFSESVRQISLYRDILRNPATGLWHHARDWDGGGILSPQGWGRGQGWVLRGVEKSIEALPADHPGRYQLLNIFEELLATILEYRNGKGLWNQLLHRADSGCELSGSGLVVAALTSPVRCIPGLPPAMLSITAERLLDFVDGVGVVDAGCPECPPLRTEQDYLDIELRPGDPHTQAAVLMALARLRAALKKGSF